MAVRDGGVAIVVPLWVACVVGATARAESREIAASPPPPSIAAVELPEPTATAAVLELPGDGFLQGTLQPSGKADGRSLTTVRWQSPLFPQPIEFRLDAIQRIRFAKRPAPTAGGAWRADLQDGDTLIGELESIDADHVVLRVPGVAGGPLRIRRSAVVRLARPTAALKVVVPGDAEGWAGPRGVVRGQAGRILFGRSESLVTRDVAAPSRACFEVAISWDERPEFEIHFALDPASGKNNGKPDATIDSYRIETVAGDVIALREVAKLEFESVGSLAAGAGSLRLLVFVDQERGRLAVVAADGPSAGRILFDESVTPRKPTALGGVGVRLRQGGLRIDSLRVAAWKTEEPQFPKTADLGGPDAVVESFDRAKGSFGVRTADAVREVPAADVSAIEFSPPPAAAPSAAELVLAMFHDGSRLTGRLIEITPSGLRLDCPSLADQFECVLAETAVLEPRAVSAIEIPGRPGLLEAAGGRAFGCLVGPAGAGIGWQLRGAVAPVAVGPAAAMRIRYRGLVSAGKEAGKEKAPGKVAANPAAGLATVYLKTGDSIQCTVLSAGPEGARIRTDLETDILVPTVAIRAIELLPSAAASIPKDKFARLLTLPRMQQASPPTHMLRLTSGDYLRGKLVSLDEKVVRFDVLGTVKEIPRPLSARLIWLSLAGDDSQSRAADVIMGAGGPGGVPVRAKMGDDRWLSFSATRIDGDRLIGRNGVFGTASVDLAGCEHLDLGPAAAEVETGTIPYSQWRLQPAAMPRAAQ